jgi:hypothetical protein
VPRAGAQIVIGGRLTDPALVAGPMIHEFGWSPTTTTSSPPGTMAGHIAECGAQCTGGNYTGWREVKDFVRIGYPIIEASPDGTFVVTKHDGTGGLVSRNTVVSQLLYEMGDPKRYLGPDCTADFTSARIEEVGKDRVRLSGIKGGPDADLQGLAQLPERLQGRPASSPSAVPTRSPRRSCAPTSSGAGSRSTAARSKSTRRSSNSSVPASATRASTKAATRPRSCCASA